MDNLLDKQDPGERTETSEGISFTDLMKGDQNAKAGAWFGGNDKSSDSQVTKSGFPSVLLWDSNKEAKKNTPSEYGLGGPAPDSKFQLKLDDNSGDRIKITPETKDLLKPPSETTGPMGKTSGPISFGGIPETPAEKAQRAQSEAIEHQQKFDRQKPLNVESPQKAPKVEPVVEPIKVEAPKPVEPNVTLVEKAAVEKQVPKTAEELMAGIRATCEESKVKSFEQIQKTAAEFMERNGMKIPGPGKVVALVLAGGILLGALPAQASEKGEAAHTSGKDGGTLGTLEKAQPYLKAALDIGAFLPPTAAACIVAGVCESVSEPVIDQFSHKNRENLRASLESQRDLGCLAWMLDNEHSRFPLDQNGRMMGVGEIKAHAIQAAQEIMNNAKAEAHKGMPDGKQSKEEIILEIKRQELISYLRNVGTPSSMFKR